MISRASSFKKLYLPSCHPNHEIGLGRLPSRTSPGVSFLKVQAKLAGRPVPAPETPTSESVSFPLLERGGSCQKHVAEPVEGEETAFRAQMRWEGHFLTLISGYLLRGPYVPILSPSVPAAGQMEFRMRNSRPLLLLSAAAAV